VSWRFGLVGNVICTWMGDHLSAGRTAGG